MFDFKRIFIAVLLVIACYFITDYLWQIFITDGSDKLVLRAILIAASILGLAHIVLFLLRKSFEKDRDPSNRPRKRYLEKARNIVNYITPFILLLMLYHFWEQDWILTTLIIAVLLIDRVNDLLRKNK